AREVMANYHRHSVDVMIDLEHLSLDDYSPNYDPDARGWCKLAVRNGELWAVDVVWTKDGAERLSEKRQRFVSPTISYDAETGRVTEIYNIGLVANPATDHAAPLMAASRKLRPTSVARLAVALSSLRGACAAKQARKRNGR